MRLDVEALAKAMHEAGVCMDWSPGYWSLDARGRRHFDWRGDHAAHVRQAKRIAEHYWPSGPMPAWSWGPTTSNLAAPEPLVLNPGQTVRGRAY